MYTIYGMIIGFLITFIFCKWKGISFSSSSSRIPSDSEIIMFLGIILFGSIGFGYGASLFLNGAHYYNKLINYSFR